MNIEKLLDKRETHIRSILDAHTIIACASPFLQISIKIVISIFYNNDVIVVNNMIHFSKHKTKWGLIASTFVTYCLAYHLDRTNGSDHGSI